jgi:signal transduction histidine kinase/DNA-binding response OmpR family regulator
MSFWYSLTGRLFKLVFGWYLVLAIAVTAVQLGLEYSSISRDIDSNLESLGRSFVPSVAEALWSFDQPQLATMADGIAKTAFVTGVRIESPQGGLFAQTGVIPPADDAPAEGLLAPYQHKRFPLEIKTPHNEQKTLGYLLLYSDRSVALTRIKYSFFVILINSLIKTAGLWLIFYLVITRSLARPLASLTDVVSRIEFAADTASDSKVTAPLTVAYAHQDEFARLLSAMGKMQKRVANAQQLVASRTEELARALATAESANRMKSAFLSNVSHELRTPLNAILGFAQIMARDPRIPEDERENLRTIDRSGNHLLALINDVLEISRIEAGGLTPKPSPFDLPELLSQLRASVALPAHNKGLNLRVTCAPTVPRFVLADAVRLRQILLNLLGNAVKYTQQGEIELSVDADTAGARPVLTFAVRDTGVGIAADELNSIFEPFFQASSGVALGEGSGLGLAISREYAHLLGGSLTVESEPRGGSIFRLAVPVDLAEAAAPERLDHGSVLGLLPGQDRQRILVVEDDAASSHLMTEILKQAEFQVRTAKDGEQAVQAFLSWHPNFIWMDMRMPVMDGYEATRRIRALPGGAAVKIVALTASALQEDRGEIIATGCDEVLAKPVEVEQIFATMARLLDLRYRYADKPVAVDGPANAPVIDFGRLPAHLCDELRRAADLLDVEAAGQAIDRLREFDGGLADKLEALVRAYRFDRIVSLCDGR